MQSDGSSSLKSRHGTEHPREKRCRANSETSSRKRRRLSQQPSDVSLAEGNGLCGSAQNPPPDQLPSPSLTKSGREPIEPSSASPAGKRKAKSLDCCPPSKQLRLRSEPAHSPSPIDTWLSKLPPSEDFEPLENGEHLDDMSQPPSKRSRSSDSLSGRLSQSGDGSDTVVSRGKKYSPYQNVNYSVVLETKGSYMRPSKAGLIDADKELCKKLLTTSRPTPEDILLNNHSDAFYANLQGRSEARIYLDLHPRIVPSVENLYISGRKEFDGLIEGHNDPWLKSIPLCGPRPQPDHTLGFKWSTFTEQQRRKLGIDPAEKSYYMAREDIYFPYLTTEVKCGKHGLDLADKPNAHSMTIALRGIVDLYRRANRPTLVHRRALGFSISYNDDGARIHVYYPEVEGDKTTYWRQTLKKFSFGNDEGKERWTCYQFTLNVCEMFALPLLDRLRKLIDELPDPAAQSLELAATFDESSVQSSQNDASAPEPQDESFKKPRNPRGLNAEFRKMIQSLQRQLEQQRQDAEQQRQDAEEQRQEMKEREILLLTQLEQQRKESEQQRKEADEQQKQLMEMLKRQGDQITHQSEQINRLLLK